MADKTGFKADLLRTINQLMDQKEEQRARAQRDKRNAEADVVQGYGELGLNSPRQAADRAARVEQEAEQYLLEANLYRLSVIASIKNQED